MSEVLKQATVDSTAQQCKALPDDALLVLGSNLHPLQRLILLAHIGRSGTDRNGHLSDRTVAALERSFIRNACGIRGSKTISRHLGALLDAGILTPHTDRWGRNQAGVYRRHVERLVAPSPPAPRAGPVRKDHGIGVRRRVFLLSDGRCTICGATLRPGWHMDHVTPLSKGGPDEESNLQALCPPCNQAKGAA